MAALQDARQGVGAGAVDTVLLEQFLDRRRAPPARLGRSAREIPEIEDLRRHHVAGGDL